jgi:hypothetical protein
MCFTNDVDVIEGNWVRIGQLDLADGFCTACDPHCDGDQYRLALQMKPGRYEAAVFEHPMNDGAVDVLGLSIMLADSMSSKS